jgi:hypothetical protein
VALYRRSITQLAAIAIALFAVFALAAQPASAAGHDVGTRGELSRCLNSAYYQCLYWYGNGTGAYWGIIHGLGGQGDANLGDNRFFSGTGAGAGSVVRNNAAAMDCDYFVDYDCAAYYSPNYAGNYDYAFYGLGGTLFFTWNDEASVFYL